MRVYHYLSAKWALDDLSMRRLKIATFDDLNDPFELLSFDMKDPTFRRALKRTKEQMAHTRGFLCFSRSWKHPVLWSHYADKHRGICLGFDVRDDLLKEVTYTEDRLDPNIRGLGSEDVQLEIVQKMLWTKYQGWSYEDEMRAYATLEEKDESTKLYFKPFDHDMELTEIVVGSLCDVTKTALAVC